MNLPHLSPSRNVERQVKLKKNNWIKFTWMSTVLCQHKNQYIMLAALYWPMPYGMSFKGD